MLFTQPSRFEKEYKKLPKKLKDKIVERLKIFVTNEFDPLLNNHMVKYKYEGHRSINLTGDWRILYKKIDHKTYELYAVGTHHQLFGKWL